MTRYLHRRVDVRVVGTQHLVGAGVVVRAWHWRGRPFRALLTGLEVAHVHPGDLCRCTVLLDDGRRITLSIRRRLDLYLGWAVPRA